MKKLLETRILTLEVLTLLDIKMHQLFGLCKEGHLQAYDNRGRKVVDINSCEKGIKRSYERIEMVIRLNEGSKIADSVLKPWHHGVIEKPLTKEEINKKAWEEYNAQPLDTPINPDPENCVLFDFSPSKKNFKSAMAFEFGKDEVLTLVKEKTLLKSEPEQKPTEQVPTYTKDTVDQNNILIRAIAFYQDGDVWKIGKKGSEKTFNHLKGFGYIAFLIRYKNKPFKPLEVYYFGKVPDEYKYINKVDFQEIGNTFNLKKHIKYLKEKLTTETDHNKRIEINHQIAELGKIKNEGIRAFKQKSDSCRGAVYKAIKTAVKRIQKEPPTLKEYFNYGQSEVIKTGNTFSYQQDNFALSVQWVLDKPS